MPASCWKRNARRHTVKRNPAIHAASNAVSGNSWRTRSAATWSACGYLSPNTFASAPGTSSAPGPTPRANTWNRAWRCNSSTKQRYALRAFVSNGHSANAVSRCSTAYRSWPAIAPSTASSPGTPSRTRNTCNTPWAKSARPPGNSAADSWRSIRIVSAATVNDKCVANATIRTAHPPSWPKPFSLSMPKRSSPSALPREPRPAR